MPAKYRSQWKDLNLRTPLSLAASHHDRMMNDTGYGSGRLVAAAAGHEFGSGLDPALPRSRIKFNLNLFITCGELV
jgi:hypothetical protein